ncbi:hypothetical protein [Streptomyces xiaopingdaonensis]|uniref:hypothetical protein n=1 Tax=Streptomyces xiaopingdaonensis TaxID=1565415 RepID=UPI0002FA7341|nr:hypothetical protein [Streptomyces xiaopingdaonensis]
MSPRALPAARQPDDESGLPGAPLLRYATERATGVLLTPRGRFYLDAGEVACVEAPEVPGLGARLTGHIPSARWQEAVRAAGGRDVGAFLLAERLLSRGELEICHLQAVLDAAYCALPRPHERTEFVPDVAHWLGDVRATSAPALLAAVVRRRAWLRRLLPWPEPDTTPLLPRAHPPAAAPRDRALLDAADGRRTPYQLAHGLRVSVCAVLLQARSLHAAGLLAPVRGTPRRTAHPASPGPPRRAHPRPPLPAAVHEAADPEISLLLRLRNALEERL